MVLGILTVGYGTDNQNIVVRCYAHVCVFADILSVISNYIVHLYEKQ
jgi:hypothetical protein